MPQSKESVHFVYDLTDTYHEFTYVVSAYVIWSADGAFYVEEDSAITVNSFLVPVDTLYAPALGCKQLHVMGRLVGGTAYIKGIYATHGITDAEVPGNRGGVDC